MRKDLQYLRYKTYEEWLRIRRSLTTLGGSDISTCVGLNPYKHARKLFDEKIGLWTSDQEENLATYGGKCLEDTIISKYWQYWDPENPTPEAMLTNAVAGKIIRKAKKVNAIIINPKYPWLAISIDRECVDKRGRGVIDAKSALGFVVNKWENGTDVGYVMQVQIYEAVGIYDWGEIALLKDGRFPDVIPIEPSKSLQEGLLERTKLFHDKIIQGIQIMKSDMPYEEKMMALEIIAPQPDGSDAYENYMKERYSSEDMLKSITGGVEQRRLAVRYLKAGETMNKIKEYQALASNRLRNYMLKNQANSIAIANNNDITWKADKNNKATFRVSKKILEYGSI